MISSYDDVNSIILAGRADLCALGRAHLHDPNWTLHAAAEQGYDGPAAAWPDWAAGRRAAADRPHGRAAAAAGAHPRDQHARWSSAGHPAHARWRPAAPGSGAAGSPRAARGRRYGEPR